MIMDEAATGGAGLAREAAASCVGGGGRREARRQCARV